LTTVHLSDQFTNPRLRRRRQTNKLGQRLVDLVVANPLPIHTLEHTFDQKESQEVYTKNLKRNLVGDYSAASVIASVIEGCTIRVSTKVCAET